VNPLVAGPPTLPQEASPYYPSSRRYRNLVYLHVEDVPGAELVGEELTAIAQAGRALNGERRINRDAVYGYKRAALEKIWPHFQGDADFDHYRAEQGTSLAQYATYCVLSERFGSDWRRWPEEFRRPDGAGVQRLATESADRVQFHAWIQWLLERQLAAATRELPIMQDLPIGFDPGGADAWAWQDLLALDMHIGAPPDLYNTGGQNWGLPPFIPHKLVAAHYEPYIETIRACLRHAGGLRIDHVIGLFRLFWIPAGAHSSQGTYVRYPADDLLNILSLESVRAGAVIVGEDLGTVEEHVRHSLHDHRLLSYRVLYFEPKPPEEYPYLSLATVTTHDLPTIAGLWTGRDLQVLHQLGLNPNEQGMRELRDRVRDLGQLAEDASIAEVVEGAHRALAHAPSAIVTATIEDAVGIEERPNIPSTMQDQWPNWSMALPLTIDELEHSAMAQAIADALNQRAHQTVH
jgi:4-alpha-glucanotransferase